MQSPLSLCICVGFCIYIKIAHIVAAILSKNIWTVALYLYMYIYTCIKKSRPRSVHTAAATLWKTATPYNTLQHTTTQCDTLQHAAIYCNTLQHTATHHNTMRHTTTRRNILQHTATHYNTLQHTATHCNTLHHIVVFFFIMWPQLCARCAAILKTTTMYKCLKNTHNHVYMFKKNTQPCALCAAKTAHRAHSCVFLEDVYMVVGFYVAAHRAHSCGHLIKTHYYKNTRQRIMHIVVFV